MSEYPILFSGPMVRAILEGRKTQTRRVIEPQIPDYGRESVVPNMPVFFWKGERFIAPYQLIAFCPYGQPGDTIWVRETWQARELDGNWWHEIKREDRPLYNWAWTNPVCPAYEDLPPKWLPSIHMPREACRLTLSVVNVRVERLQDISENDAIAEGLEFGRNGFYLPGGYSSSVLAYRDLWNGINSNRPGYTWDANPHVWMIEFVRATA